ncbi:MAG: glycosyltransferase [Desulfurococcaceae archaeon]
MSNNRPRLLVIGPLPPPFGGIALFVWNIYRNKILRRKYRIYIHRTGKRFKAIGHLRQSLIELGRIFRLFIYMMFYKYDLIHIHTSSYWGFAYNVIYFILSKLPNKNAKIIIHVHSGEFYKSLSYGARYFVKRILETADSVLVTSPKWVKEFKELISSRLNITYITNGYDPNTFKIIDKVDARRRLNLPLDKKIILCVANFYPVKGHVYLVMAVKKLVHQRRDILVVLVGEGPLKDRIKDLINRCNLNEYFSMINWITPEALNLFYNGSDVVVLSSLAEGSPLVLLEALGCGKPFVGTKVGGIQDIITSEKYGLLCEPKDFECLAEKILNALNTEWDNDDIRRYGSKYTWEAVSLRLLSIYKIMLG